MAFQSDYPATLDVDYPDYPRDRLTTFFRIFTVIPIAIILGLLSGASYTRMGEANPSVSYGAVGVLILPTILMIVFRQKYPRWWFDWNLALTRFSYRVS